MLPSLRTLSTFAFLTISLLLASQTSAKSTPYVPSPHVSAEVWETVTPYLFPDNLPEKAALDEIFSKTRVLSSLKDMKKVGFSFVADPADKIIVAKHPKLKGYLIKAYLDHLLVYEWEWWIKRINGTKIIQNAIDTHGYQTFMKTPHKWIYALPAGPDPLPGHYRRNFVLVVEEIDILSHKKNRAAYKKKMSRERLDALYTVIMENFLIDSVYADNVPFCEDGKLAFIDTEHANDHTQPVPIWSIAQYLSDDLYGYWEQLTIHGVQK